MNETFISELSELLNRDRSVLINILRNRRVLNVDNRLNEDVIRKHARESLKPILQLFKEKGIPEKQIFSTIQENHEIGDEENTFCLIFFYCEYYDVVLPDLLLPIAINKTALKIYFDEWVFEKQRLSEDMEGSA